MGKTRLTETRKGAILAVLFGHIGEENSIDMGVLFEKAFGKPWKNKINDTRPLRSTIEKLRAEGTAICSSPKQDGGGYYIARAGSELTEYLDRRKQAALRVLEAIAKTEKTTLLVLLGQMQLNLTGGEHESV